LPAFPAEPNCSFSVMVATPRLMVLELTLRLVRGLPKFDRPTATIAFVFFGLNVRFPQRSRQLLSAETFLVARPVRYRRHAPWGELGYWRRRSAAAVEAQPPVRNLGGEGQMLAIRGDRYRPSSPISFLIPDQTGLSRCDNCLLIAEGTGSEYPNRSSVVGRYRSLVEHDSPRNRRAG